MQEKLKNIDPKYEIKKQVTDYRDYILNEKLGEFRKHEIINRQILSEIVIDQHYVSKRNNALMLQVGGEIENFETIIASATS